MDHNKLCKVLTEMELKEFLKTVLKQANLTCLLRNLYAGQETTDMEQLTGSKLGKGYVKAVYCHPIYLTYMQSKSHKILG